jgi:hypothetical protein
MQEIKGTENYEQNCSIALIKHYKQQVDIIRVYTYLHYHKFCGPAPMLQLEVHTSPHQPRSTSPQYSPSTR